VIPSFESYLTSLTPVSQSAPGAEPEALEACARATALLVDALPLSREKLSQILSANPEVTAVIAAAANLSQERFKTWLKATFGTAGWITLARERPDDLAAALDESFAIVEELQAQAERQWTWADALARTMAPRQRAGRAVRQGRDLEDAVEVAIASLGLPFAPRGRFEGTAGRSAPVDFAIPDRDAATQIAVAVKGFDSTGSKLTDARREIEEMATVRKPRQFIFAIVDGHGWLRRESDLRRIHKLWESGEIDGLYNRTTLNEFTTALRDAATRLSLPGIVDDA
jgi:hypothetical protein